MTEGGQDVLAHDIGAAGQGTGLPVPGVAFEELVGELGHGVPRCPGAVVRFPRFDVAGDQRAGLAPCLGDGHGVGVADPGMAPSPAHHAGEEEGSDAGGLDRQPQAGDHIVADFVALLAGLGGPDTPGEGGFGFVCHGCGSCSGRAAGRDRENHKALTLQAFPPLHAMADAGRKCITDASGVRPTRRRASLSRFLTAQTVGR